MPGLPGGADLAALARQPQQPQFVPKQTTYPVTMIEVQRSPVGGQVALIVQAPASGEVLIFPMDASFARQLGAKLTSAAIVLPPDAETAPAEPAE